MTEKFPLTSPPSDAGKEEATNLEEFRARGQEHRTRKKEKKQEKKGKQEKKREEREEETRERFQKGVPEKDLAPPSQTTDPLSTEEESHRQWEIEALEGAQKDLEKEKTEREKEKPLTRLAGKEEEGIIEDMKGIEGAPAPIEEAPQDAKTPSSRTEKLEAFTARRKELAKRLQTAYLYYNEKNEEERKQHEKDIEEFNVRSMAERHGFNSEQIEEEIKQEKEKIEKRDATAGSYKLFQLERAKELIGREIGVEEKRQEPQVEEARIEPPPAEVREVEPREEPQTPPLAGQARGEKIAAFRVRRMEIEKKNKEEGWDSDEDFQKFGMESADRETAGNYNFDSKKIDEAIEQAKKEANQKYREQSIERLQRAKALIEREIESEESEEKEPQIPPLDSGQTEQWSYPEEKKETWEQGVPPLESTGKEEWTYGEEQKQAGEIKKEEEKESPEMKAAIEELLGSEMAGNERVREAAGRVIEARGVMIKSWPEVLAQKKEQEKKLPALMERAKRWMKSAVQETPELHLRRLEQERSYNEARDTLIRTLLEEAKKEGRDVTAITGKAWELDTAESRRLNELKERASPHEWLERTQKMSRFFNYPFEKVCDRMGWDKKTARHLRIVTGATVMGGVAFFGGAGAAIAGLYMGQRLLTPYVTSAILGLSSLGIEYDSQRVLNKKIKALSGERKEILDQEIGANERAGAIVEAISRQRAEFNDKLESVIRTRRIYKGIAQGVLIGGIGLASVSHAFANTAKVSGLPEESPVKPYIAIQEDSFRGRINAALERLTKAGKDAQESMKRMEEWGAAGKSSTESAASALEEAAPKTSGSGGDIWTHQEAPMGPEFPKTEGALGVPKTGAEGALPGRSYGTSGESITTIEKAVAVGEPTATIGKGSNIWEASRSLIGEGEGKISKNQWLEAWEKSGLADKGFVKPGAIVHFDAAEGILKVSEAKDNEFLYQALQKEGKPIPSWLEDWRDVKEGRSSVTDVVDKSADNAVARPAAPPTEILETPVAGAKGGTFEQLLQNEEAQKYYTESFGKHSFDQQEALLAEFKNAAERLEENIKGDVHSSVRAAYEREVAQTKSFINALENNAEYQGNLRAWEALGKEWVKKVVGDEAQFEELSNKWSVERFLDTAKKIENRDFVPSDELSKILEARRMGTLEMAEKIRSKLPDRGALKLPLGRFLKNTL